MGENPYISPLYFHIDITLSQLLLNPSWDDGSHKHLIRVMTFSPFSPFGPGSPGTPSSPTGPGKPGFPWKGKYIITSFFSHTVCYQSYWREVCRNTSREIYFLMCLSYQLLCNWGFTEMIMCTQDVPHLPPPKNELWMIGHSGREKQKCLFAVWEDRGWVLISQVWIICTHFPNWTWFLYP